VVGEAVERDLEVIDVAMTRSARRSLLKSPRAITSPAGQSGGELVATSGRHVLEQELRRLAGAGHEDI